MNYKLLYSLSFIFFNYRTVVIFFPVMCDFLRVVYRTRSVLPIADLLLQHFVFKNNSKVSIDYLFLSNKGTRTALRKYSFIDLQLRNLFIFTTYSFAKDSFRYCFSTVKTAISGISLLEKIIYTTFRYGFSFGGIHPHCGIDVSEPPERHFYACLEASEFPERYFHAYIEASELSERYFHAYLKVSELSERMEHTCLEASGLPERVFHAYIEASELSERYFHACLEVSELSERRVHTCLKASELPERVIHSSLGGSEASERHFHHSMGNNKTSFFRKKFLQEQNNSTNLKINHYEN